MIMPCEVAVRSVVPAIRALVAIELTYTYELKQNDVAKLLGITQTAVSKYIHRVRGNVFAIENVKEIQPVVKHMAVSLTNGNMSRSELMSNFCKVCQIIRQKKLMCEYCRRSDPLVGVEDCSFCLGESSFREDNNK